MTRKCHNHTPTFSTAKKRLGTLTTKRQQEHDETKQTALSSSSKLDRTLGTTSQNRDPTQKHT